MENIDIFDENNIPTGITKEKTQAHEDGNFHRTAHIWIMNRDKELLLKKRSATKKSHPNCWDISDAGHIRAGETVVQGADYVMHEAFCLETEAEKYKPREKNHDTVKTASIKAENLGVKNLVLWHSQENLGKDRKEIYSQEAKENYTGNIYVPDDLDEIIL